MAKRKQPTKAKAKKTSGKSSVAGSAKAKKTSGKSSVAGSAVPLIEQPHGGALQRGNPGNVGGSGRPPEALRAASRELYEKWLLWAKAKLEAKDGQGNQIAKDEVLNQIGNTAGKYGFPQQDMISRQAVRDILQRQIDVTLATLKAEDAERLLAAIHPLWFPA